jgi:hypothetical protein
MPPKIARIPRTRRFRFASEVLQCCRSGSGKPSLSFFGGSTKKHVQRLSQKEIEAEAELMMALAEDEDTQPDDGAVEIPSEEEYVE